MAHIEESRCVKCDAVMFEPAGSERCPCPACGATGRSFPVTLEDTLVVHEGYRLKHYKSGSPKFSIDDRYGPSYFRVGQEWHHLQRTIDRENDRYTETVRVLSTGELIRHVDHPLSEHVDRGGSKNQNHGSEP